jgi:hypothetical protein
MAEQKLATREYVDKTGLKRILYNYTTSSYPPRPSGVPAGMVQYQGPVIPTDWLIGDDWEDVS